MKQKQLKWLIIGFVALLGFIWWAKGLSNTSSVAFWNDTKIACLSNGHQSIAMHIHPKMIITVDGVSETLPANIGLTPACMSEVHTHDETGEIHIESSSPGRAITLADFFSVWGRSIDREGYTYALTLNGQPFSDMNVRSLKDGDMIVLAYTKQ